MINAGMHRFVRKKGSGFRRLTEITSFCLLILGSNAKANTEPPLPMEAHQAIQEAQSHQAFERLRNSPIDYRSIGSICEQLARLEFNSFYQPPRYEVLSGVVYFNATGRILGELDLVVMDTHQQRALLIMEVKCSRRPERALAHAQEQMQRVRNALRDGVVNNLVWRQGQQVRNFEPQQFSSPDVAFGTISVDGSTSVGYDYALGMDHQAALELRLRMIECQESGRCTRP